MSLEYKKKCLWHLEGFCCKYAPDIKAAHKIWQCFEVDDYCKEYEERRLGVFKKESKEKT